MSKDNRMADRLVHGVRKAKGATTAKQTAKPAPKKAAPRKAAPGKTTGRPAQAEPAHDALHPERIWPD